MVILQFWIRPEKAVSLQIDTTMTISDCKRMLAERSLFGLTA
jgi:hypothetical protein